MDEQEKKNVFSLRPWLGRIGGYFIPVYVFLCIVNAFYAHYIKTSAESFGLEDGKGFTLHTFQNDTLLTTVLCSGVFFTLWLLVVLLYRFPFRPRPSDGFFMTLGLLGCSPIAVMTAGLLLLPVSLLSFGVPFLSTGVVGGAFLIVFLLMDTSKMIVLGLVLPALLLFYGVVRPSGEAMRSFYESKKFYLFLTPFFLTGAWLIWLICSEMVFLALS